MQDNQGKALRIIGGQKLSGGRVSISGSSNQVTKCMIASLLTNDDVLIKNAPQVTERKAVEDLFVHLGGEVHHYDENTIKLNARPISHNSISEEICQKNRISILALGPLLHRFGSVSLFANMGGDRIGKRPVDFHIKGYQEMGAHVEFDEKAQLYLITTKGLHGAHIVLPFPSVMTTENLIIGATLAKGRTIIENAAIEPEIIELVKMLQKMGADIAIDANRRYVIQGVSRLRGCEVTVMPDRNQAVSFACAALATGGDVLLEHISHDSSYSFLNYIQRMGAEFQVTDKGIHVSSPRGRRLSHSHIEVEVHPGFMTDWQQPFMVLFTQAEGVSILHETIFENRLDYTRQLNEMGAKIHLHSTCLGESPCRFKNKNHDHSALIYGPTPLVGRDFQLPIDIRACMCLVIAGLVASGTTVLSGIHELQRKYDNITDKLSMMGANISLI